MAFKVDWLKEVREICRKIFCHALQNWGGVKCEDYRMSTILAATLIMSFIIGGGLWSGSKTLYSLLSQGVQYVNRDTGAHIPGPKTQNQSLRNMVSSEAENCDLTKDKWQLWLGEMSRDVRDDSHYFLPDNSYRGLFKYESEINNVSVCEFIFVPRGDSVINYVISFSGVFQVVIGDNDYKTVTLRASDAIDGPLYPIKEIQSGSVRPRLSSTVKPGSSIRVKLQQKSLDNGRYEVRVSVTYKNNVQENTEDSTEDFLWEFNPSPSIDLHALELSIGLIRGQGDVSSIGVSFISPNLDQATTSD